jgi:hypothetical protein
MAWTCRIDGIGYAYIIGARKSFEKIISGRTRWRFRDNIKLD